MSSVISKLKMSFWNSSVCSHSLVASSPLSFQCNELMSNKSIDMIFRFSEFGLIILGWLNSKVRFLQ